ncbi:MAG: hypothetical protein LBV71_20245 [Prevotella sp.]|jgi:hypothetical protein|nr:hypothetical protein [Prevotella sp.]
MFSWLKKIFSKENKSPKNPEDAYLVTITDEYVKVEHPRRATESICWEEINEIWLINTDDGPLLPDVFLALVGEKGGCLIPQGANGFDEVYDIVSKYNGFNFENVIKSMACADNQRFILWGRNI